MKHTLDYNVYLDKVEGCWLGKSIAGVIGAPFEAQKIFEELKPENLWPKKIYPNDDLDIQIIWLEMMEEVGTNVTHEKLVEFWRDRCWYNFAEYGYFLYNAQRGIDPPLSGHFNNSYFRESEGCPIRAEVWGMVAPGNSELAASYAKLDGTLDHIENSVYAEMFWAAANAQAFITDNLEEIINAGLSVIPEDCDITKIVYDVFLVIDTCETLKEMWLTLIRIWGDRDSSKSKINFAFSLLPLLYGELDFKKTMTCACDLTFDTDCTAGTACSLLGTIIGAKAFPEDWLDQLGKELTCDVNAHRHQGVLISEFAENTCKVGVEGMLNKNNKIDIIDIPEGIYELAAERYYSRETEKDLEISISYEVADNNPAIINGVGSCEVVIKNNSFKAISGLLKLESLDEVALKIIANETLDAEVEFEVEANSTEKLLINAILDDNAEVLWSKNLIKATISTDDDVYEKIFGFVGANLWTVYGPYWDAYDKSKYDINPYRNEEINEHPNNVGSGRMMFHQFVDINEKYLDEDTLLDEDIIEEFPFNIELAEDVITNEDISHHMGESCYYFTRTFVSSETRDVEILVGATGPFIMWINGKEVMKSDIIGGWCPQDFSAKFDVLEDQEYRLVVKAVQITDEFKFSLNFVMNPNPESKEYGKSWILDTFGSVI